MTAGAELRDNVRQNQGANEGDPALRAFDIRQSSWVPAAYVQDEIKLHRRLLVNVGARYDSYGSYGKLSPRGAVIYTPSTHESFKYLYGTAFRAPNAYERDYYSAGVPNLALRPETITTHEVVWERYTSQWLRTSLSAYGNRAHHLLTLTTDAANAGAAVANLTLSTPIGRSLEIVGSVRNLLDRRYADPASEEHRQDAIEQDGRTARVGLQVNFGRR